MSAIATQVKGMFPEKQQFPLRSLLVSLLTIAASVKTKKDIPISSINHDEKLWSEILAYQNDDVIDFFKHTHPRIEVEAEVLWLECKRFLYVSMLSKERNSPSKAVDEMWHTFILYTEDYVGFCNRFNQGVYMHHRPIREGAEKIDSFPRTRSMIVNLFGSADPRVWGDAACCSCGASCD